MNGKNGNFSYQHSEWKPAEEWSGADQMISENFAINSKPSLKVVLYPSMTSSFYGQK